MPTSSRKFSYKYRLLHLVIGILFTILTLGLIVNLIPFTGDTEANITLHSWPIMLFTTIQALLFIYSALGTYLNITSTGVLLRLPFSQVESPWENIERIGSVKIPNSIYSEPGIVFRKPPYLMQTRYQRLFLPKLLDNKVLFIASYLSDNDSKELEVLALQFLDRLEHGRSQ